MNNVAIILAAGSGLRAQSEIPKQFEIIGNQPILNYSIKEFIASKLFKKIIVVLPKNFENRHWKNVFESHITIVHGGAERDESVNNAISAIGDNIFDCIFIHDAARPGIDTNFLKEILNSFEKNIDGIIPVLPCNDAMWKVENNILVSPIDRSQIKRAQTPQAFSFAKYIYARNISKNVSNILDDAQIAINAGLKVKFINGTSRLDKITMKEDFKKMENSLLDQIIVSRNGIGFDAHRFCSGNELVLCGIKIPSDFGLEGHSDADVAWHALVDALLGAIGEGDIGQAFPPNEIKWKGAASSLFLEYARDKIKEKNAIIENVDLTIICEAPKIGPYRDLLRNSTAELLQIDRSQVNIKATTTEKMGFTGRKEGIAALASATILMKRGVNNVF